MRLCFVPANVTRRGDNADVAEALTLAEKLNHLNHRNSATAATAAPENRHHLGIAYRDMTVTRENAKAHHRAATYAEASALNQA